MKTGNIVQFVSGLFLLVCFFAAGCSTTTTKVTHNQGATVGEAIMERADGPKARVAVGDFQVKAAGASIEIGDGLREMLLTALFNNNRFIVLERQAIKDVILEQDLGASGMVKQETAPVLGELEGAEILVYGVVSEFKPDASGGGIDMGMARIPLKFGMGKSKSHMAIDLRAVDTSTGRILFAARVEGKASDYDTRIGTRVGGGNTIMPVSLGTYNNTPMEKAIRVCIDRAVEVLGSKVPSHYYHYE